MPTRRQLQAAGEYELVEMIMVFQYFQHILVKTLPSPGTFSRKIAHSREFAC